ncbi:hypothetical protein [Thiohalobacter thiocyanaticus]|uniref:Uncharacterized protein n=1 Tax=Thiohalobacter thiocyanaticus TaxID=585455 RepID=A0A426QDS6_9GAMM|nr:hypothetical protein [Thiohalobacter thiocyanaticus]RRQ19915.1 hypothetical protein D6C00_14210 [Thiohalobacter thiocyanaticus]
MAHGPLELMQLADGIDSLGGDLKYVASIGNMNDEKLSELARHSPEEMEQLFQRFQKIDKTLSSLQSLLEHWQGRLALAQREATAQDQLDS